MTLVVNFGIFFGVIVIILLVTLREVSLYRADQKSDLDFCPYTKARLVRRLAISALLTCEAVLLLPLRLTLSPSRPLWFFIYVSLTTSIAGGMVLLAWLDLRESGKLLLEGKERLKKEFLQELQEDRRTPPLH